MRWPAHRSACVRRAGGCSASQAGSSSRALSSIHCCAGVSAHPADPLRHGPGSEVAALHEHLARPYGQRPAGGGSPAASRFPRQGTTPDRSRPTRPYGSPAVPRHRAPYIASCAPVQVGDRLLPRRSALRRRVVKAGASATQFAIIILEVGVPAGIGAQTQLDALAGEGEAVAPGPWRRGGGHLGEGRGQGGAGGRYHRWVGGVGLFGDGEAGGARRGARRGRGGRTPGRFGAGVLDQVMEPLGSRAARRCVRRPGAGSGAGKWCRRTTAALCVPLRRP